jgi:hypothetical protein
MGLYAGGMGGLLVGQGTCVALALFLIGTRGVGLGLLARRQLRFSAHSGILIGIDPALLLYNLLVVPASAFRKAVWK